MPGPTARTAERRRAGRPVPLPGESALPPVEHPERAKGVPAARLPRATLERRSGRDRDGRGQAASGRPAAASIARPPPPPPSGHPARRPSAGSSRARAARRSASSTGRRSRDTPDSTISPVLWRRNRPRSSRYSSPPRRASRTAVGSAGRALEFEQPVEHGERRVERGAHGAVLGLAVPSAISEPLAEDPVDERRHVHPEVGTRLDRPAVDAWLDLAVEVPLPVMLPAPVLGDERDRAAGRRGRRVEPEDLQGLQGVHRRCPGLSRFAAGVGPPGSRRRRPTTRRRPRATAAGRPSPRAPPAPARRRPRRARRR